ncbi:MAG: hypothetical protein P9L94_15795 [Candidatus Hinthialibacter antarcticus]|nr:hypothetical protein [Candidatus Hinthialibacter antarcticus]
MSASVNHLILFQRLDDRLVWIEASRDANKVQLLGAGVQPLHIDGEDLTLQSAIELVARQLQAGIWVSYEAVLAAPSHRLTARTIDAPPADDDNLRDLVAFEVSEALQVPIEDIAWDYWVSSKRTTTSPKLLWIAARKSILNDWAADWPANRIPISQITPSIWAFYEYALQSEAGLLRQPALLVMQEGDRAEIAAADSNAVYYTRTVNLSTSTEAGDTDIQQRLAQEIERTLAYVSERLIAGEIRSLIIAGFDDQPGDALESLATQHSLTLYRLSANDMASSFECKTAQPCNDHLPLLAIAYARLCAGLSGVNLLDEKEETVWGARIWEAAQPSRAFIRNAGVITAAAIVLWIASALWFNSAVDARLSEGKSLLKLATHLQNEETGLRAMAQRRVAMADVLLFLSETLSSEKKLLIKNLSFDDKDGVVLSLVGGNNQNVLKIIEQLNASKYFRDVVSDRAVMEKEGIVIYLTGKLVPGA